MTRDRRRKTSSINLDDLRNQERAQETRPRMLERERNAQTAEELRRGLAEATSRSPDSPIRPGSEAATGHGSEAATRHGSEAPKKHTELQDALSQEHRSEEHRNDPGTVPGHLPDTRTQATPPQPLPGDIVAGLVQLCPRASTQPGTLEHNDHLIIHVATDVPAASAQEPGQHEAGQHEAGQHRTPAEATRLHPLEVGGDLSGHEQSSGSTTAATDTEQPTGTTPHASFDGPDLNGSAWPTPTEKIQLEAEVVEEPARREPGKPNPFRINSGVPAMPGTELTHAGKDNATGSIPPVPPSGWQNTNETLGKNTGLLPAPGYAPVNYSAGSEIARRSPGEIEEMVRYSGPQITISVPAINWKPWLRGAGICAAVVLAGMAGLQLIERRAAQQVVAMAQAMAPGDYPWDTVTLHGTPTYRVSVKGLNRACLESEMELDSTQRTRILLVESPAVRGISAVTRITLSSVTAMTSSRSVISEDNQVQWNKYNRAERCPGKIYGVTPGAEQPTGGVINAPRTAPKTTPARQPESSAPSASLPVARAAQPAQSKAATVTPAAGAPTTGAPAAGTPAAGTPAATGTTTTSSAAVPQGGGFVPGQTTR